MIRFVATRQWLSIWDLYGESCYYVTWYLGPDELRISHTWTGVVDDDYLLPKYVVMA